MAHFRASLQGQRGTTSRLGSKASGLDVRVNGWNRGIRVTARYDATAGEDVFEVLSTGGSNGELFEEEVAVIRGKG